MAKYLHDNQKALLEDAVEQFVDAQLESKAPDIDEYAKQYPDFENQVRKRIHKLRKIDGLFSSLVKTNENEFRNITNELDFVGKQVGNFEILKIIGRGGMGVVYLARDTKLKRSVAIKSIPAALAGDPETRTRLKSEAELLASLNHPNISVIYDIIEEDECGYLILEYVPGETLTERLLRGPLGIEETLSISQQVSEAISTAHEKSIIHRDIKPSNIKITPEGRVKVLDFGLAKAQAIQNTKSEHGRVIGTPAYMSPEQACGKDIDRRTDIWAFGCILYQMLTARLPFKGETAPDTAACNIECQPDWQALPEELPSNIRALIQSCLEKDPESRLGDITEATIKIRKTLHAPAKYVPTKLQKSATLLSAAIIIFFIAIVVHYILVQSRPKEIIPTKNKDAWTYYLQGKKYYSEDFDANFLNLAIRMWEQAVEFDPNFALAHAKLSHAFSLLYWNHGKKSEDIEKAKEHIQATERLDADLPEIHLARGHYYYHGQQDYENALKELIIYLKSRPNDSEALSFVGWIYKRQGDFDRALTYLKKAYKFSPGLHFYPLHIALIYELLDDYNRAEHFYDKAISLAPDRPRAYHGKMRLHLRQGKIEKAKAVLKEILPDSDVSEDSYIAHTLVGIDVYEGNYKAALDRLLSTNPNDVSNWPYCFPNPLWRAQIYDYIWKEGRSRKQYADLAEESYNEARINLERKCQKDPNNSEYQSALGIAYAGLGNMEKAIRAGKEAVTKLPISKDAVVGPWRVQNLALIYTMAGEYEKAIDLIEILLSIPSELSIPLLQIDPAWNPLRNHPRFLSLIQEDKSNK
jgi:serine/threonine protein kinase